MTIRRTAVEDYLAALVNDSARLASQAASSASASLALPADTTPLVDRVRQLANSLPIEAQQAGVQLEWFREHLKGRGGRAARAGDVADCLRRLGWIRRRFWRDQESGFRARWYGSVAQPQPWKEDR